MALNYVTVSGTIQRPDGKAASGTVTFELDRDVLSTADNVLVLSQPVVATLSPAGVFSVRLLPLDAGVTPTNAAYKVTESLADPVKSGYFDERTFYTTIASSPATQHYADLAHLSPTRQSTLTLASLADVDVSGAADGNALTFEASSSRWHPAPGGTVDPLALHAPSDSTSDGPPSYQLAVVDDPDNWGTNALRVEAAGDAVTREVIIGDVGYDDAGFARAGVVQWNNVEGIKNTLIEAEAGQAGRDSWAGMSTRVGNPDPAFVDYSHVELSARRDARGILLRLGAEVGADPDQDSAYLTWSTYQGSAALRFMRSALVITPDPAADEDVYVTRLIPHHQTDGPAGRPGWHLATDGTIHYWDGSAWHDKTPAQPPSPVYGQFVNRGQAMNSGGTQVPLSYFRGPQAANWVLEDGTFALPGGFYAFTVTASFAAAQEASLQLSPRQGWDAMGVDWFPFSYGGGATSALAAGHLAVDPDGGTFGVVLASDGSQALTFALLALAKIA